MAIIRFLFMLRMGLVAGLAIELTYAKVSRKPMSPKLVVSKMPVRAPLSKDQRKSGGEQGDHRFNEMIRVFISSTFRDMQRERDVMMARVFPQVRRWCEQHGVIWREIDLRWGITVEEAHRGEALRLCLEEVEACSPFFIALLGERYGHVEKDLPTDLLTRFPWLKDFQGRSITEMEIEAGALSQPAPSPTVLFYFRDPEFLKRLPGGEDPSDYRSETDEAQTRLTELKQRIVASRYRIRRFSSSQELEEVMSADLLDMLATRIPASRSERLADAQWNFARTRGRFFVGPSSWLRAIDKHVASSGPPLLVTGEVGSGKSAVIAAWALNQIGEDQKVVLDLEQPTNHTSDLRVSSGIGDNPTISRFRTKLRGVRDQPTPGPSHFNES